jgi:hypothetical protein
MVGMAEVIAWLVGIAIFILIIYLFVLGDFSPGAIDPLGILTGG